jgi:hypothetical protein
VITFDSRPGTPTNSAGIPPVMTFCSWMISVFRFAPNVPVSGSVTLMPSK